MSIECGYCERDLRGEHDLDCPRILPKLYNELGNLLAYIHNDGGHYITEHGWKKAIVDAEDKVKIMKGEKHGN